MTDQPSVEAPADATAADGDAVVGVAADAPLPLGEAGAAARRVAGPAPPGAIEVVSRGLDLATQLSSSIRRMSIYVGLLFLAAVGPVAVIAVVHSVRTNGFDWLVAAFDTSGAAIRPGPGTRVVADLGLATALAVAIDLQQMAIATIGFAVTGRRVELRAAIRQARAGFWRMLAISIAIALLSLVPAILVGNVLPDRVRDLSDPLVVTLDLVLSVPFAYAGAAVVLGGARPIAALATSWRLAKRRWRLAFVISIVNTAVLYLALFGIGAGLDILSRVALALGIGREVGPVQGVELAAIIAIAIVASGSLAMTVATLAAAPPVVAWQRLGGATAGLRRADAHPLDDDVPSDRLVSRPMLAVLGVELFVTVVAALPSA